MPDADSAATLSIWGHLRALRGRLSRSLIVLVAFCAVSFSLAPQLVQIVAVPVGGIQNLTSIEVTENIGVYMRVSLLSGFILAFPFILYEMLAFIMPGLEPNEKRWVLLSIPFATVLFLGGAAFSYFVMLPTAIPFLLNILGVETTPRLSNYVDFVTDLVFWVGVSFELPLLMFLLAKLRVLTAGWLLRQWRFAIVIIAVAAAVITPTGDPINMGLLMLPLTALYLLSILLAYIANPVRKQKPKV